MAKENMKNNEKEISSVIHSVTTFLGKKGESSPLNSIFNMTAKGYETMFFIMKNQEDSTSFTKSNYFAVAVDDLGDISEFLARASEEIRREMLSTDYKALVDTKVLVDKKLSLKRGYMMQITALITVNGDSKSRTTTLTIGKIDETGDLGNQSTMYLPTKMLGFFGTAADMSFLNILSSVCASIAIGTNIRYQSHKERQYKAFRADSAEEVASYNGPTNIDNGSTDFDSDEFPF